MKARMFKTAILSTLCAFLLLTIGCGKLNKENYDKIKVGQDYNEVVEILGKADECSSAMGLKDCRWGDDNKYISVQFAGDKVVIFSSKGL